MSDYSNYTGILSVTPLEFCGAIRNNDWQYAIICLLYTVVWLLCALAIFYYSLKLKNGLAKHRSDSHAEQQPL